MSQYDADRPLPPRPDYSKWQDIKGLGPMGETIKRGSRPLTSKMIRETIEQMNRGPLPRKVGDGHATFSSSTTLDRQPFRWDSNCFYRRLGLDTTATRLDIVRRFLELDPQQDFIRLAIAAEVLLSKTKRSIYDALILGNFYAQDPALIKLRLGGELVSAADAWAVYADADVSDEDARTLTSEWRHQLSAALAPAFSKYPIMPQIGVGVCSSIFRSRWEMVGWYAVYFVPLDAEVTPEYVHSAADELLRIATPTVIRDS